MWLRELSTLTVHKRRPGLIAYTLGTWLTKHYYTIALSGNTICQTRVEGHRKGNTIGRLTRVDSFIHVGAHLMFSAVKRMCVGEPQIL
jgi:hypothetical protein